MELDSTVVTHIGIEVNADDGEIWATVMRCDALGHLVSGDTKHLKGSRIGAVVRLIERETNSYPNIVSLDIGADIEGARHEKG